jgi:hypothetical protein
VGSSGDPIRPLVAEILNIYLLIGQGGAALVFVPLCLLACARVFEKKKEETPEVATVPRKR